jgi:hypothetical protein
MDSQRRKRISAAMRSVPTTITTPHCCAVVSCGFASQVTNIGRGSLPVDSTHTGSVTIVGATSDAAVPVNITAYPPDTHVSGDVVEKVKRKASAGGEKNTPQQARQ